MGFKLNLFTTLLICETRFGLAIPGSTMKHSEFLDGAKIQQLVAKYGAAITSRIISSPLLLTRKCEAMASVARRFLAISDLTFANSTVKGIFSQHA
jgi:hypothetical protein